MPTPRSNLGTAGEQHARRHLEGRGYRWLESNWHCPAGEADLVMIDEAELVFVEVKTRRSESAGSAEESISATKSKKLLATGDWYLSAHPDLADPIWRIDLVAITLSRDGRVIRLTHVENAITA